MAWSQPHLGQAEGAGLVIALEVVFHPPGPRAHGHHDHTAWANGDSQFCSLSWIAYLEAGTWL